MLPWVTCPPPGQEQSHFSSKTFSSISSLWLSPKRLTDLSHLIPLQEHFKECTFQKWSPSCQSGPRVTGWEKTLHPVRADERHRGSLGGAGGFVCHLFFLSLQLSAAPQISQQLMGIQARQPLGWPPPTPSPSLSHSTKDVTCSPKPLSSHQLWTRPWKVHEVVTTPRKQQGTDTREARSTLFFHYIDKHITESRSSFPAKGLLPLFTCSPIPHPTP